MLSSPPLAHTPASMMSVFYFKQFCFWTTLMIFHTCLPLSDWTTQLHLLFSMFLTGTSANRMKIVKMHNVLIRLLLLYSKQAFVHAVPPTCPRWQYISRFGTWEEGYVGKQAKLANDNAFKGWKTPTLEYPSRNQEEAVWSPPSIWMPIVSTSPTSSLPPKMNPVYPFNDLSYQAILPIPYQLHSWDDWLWSYRAFDLERSYVIVTFVPWCAKDHFGLLCHCGRWGELS
jgi:hypothetical protein